MPGWMLSRAYNGRTVELTYTACWYSASGPLAVSSSNSSALSACSGTFFLASPYAILPYYAPGASYRMQCRVEELINSSFFPVILQALRQTPIIGTFLCLPYVRQVSPVIRGLAAIRRTWTKADEAQIADKLAGVRQSAV